MEKVFKNNGVKWYGACLVVIGISAIGILIYLYTAIMRLDGVTLSTLFSLYFPVLMYLLMYISIIRYVFDYFAKGEEASISGMLMRYCALTAASTVMGGSSPSYGLLVANVMILVLVPMVRENLNSKSALIVSIVVMVLCIVACVDKYTSGGAATLAAATNPFDTIALAFDIINPAVQWALFLALMLIRVAQNPPQKAAKKQITAEEQPAAEEQSANA